MTDDERNVNEDEPTAGIEVGRWYVRAWTDCKGWLVQHPLTGWYIAAIGGLLVVLNLVQIVLQLAG